MLFKNSLIPLLGVGGIIGIVGGVSYVYSNKKLLRNLQKDNLSLDVENESHKDYEDNNEQLNETNEEDDKVEDNSDKEKMETSSEPSPLVVEQPKEPASSIIGTAPDSSIQTEEVVKK